MDRRPTLEARPPVVIDAIVRALIPPACREHVVGDLWERYRSPWRFAIDAATTVPFVIVSQIRRTSTVGAVFIQAFLLFTGFSVGSGRLGRVLAPLVVGVLALVFRDAYRRSVSISAKQIAVDVLVAAGAVLVSQGLLAVIAPQLTMSMSGYASGAVVLGLVFCLRLQNPGLGAVPPRHAMAPVPATLDALVKEVRLHERLGRRAMRIEALAGLGVAIFFIVPLLSSPNWFLRIGWGLASAYGLYVAAIMSRHSPRPMPEGLEFRESLAYYRHQLERQHGYIRTMWFWYLMPFTPAMAFIVAGGAVAAAERGRPLWPALIMIAIVLAVGGVIHAGSHGMARKLRMRIDTLSAAEKQ